MKTLTAEKAATRKQLIVELYERIEHYATAQLNPLDENAQLDSVLQKIIDVEKEINVDLPKRDDKWDGFKTWCSQNSIPIDKFTIKKLKDSEYGLFANTKFNANDIILELPRKVFMTNECAKEDIKLGKFVQDVIFTHMPNLVLVFFLMNEYTKPNSFWAPYLKTLPSKYTTILYLSTEEVAQLKGSPVLEEMVKIKRNAARQYAYFWMKIECSPEFSKSNLLGSYTYEFYRWALSSVMTRQNLIPCKKDKTKNTFALIPLWDMCNHSEGIMSTDYDTVKDCLVFYSMNDVKPGDEIYNYYGDRTNAEFFLHNGFVFDDHTNDSVRVKIGISKADPTFSYKDALCRKIELPTYGTFDISNKNEHPINPKILAMVRIFLMPKEELEEWIASSNPTVLYEENCDDLSHLDIKVKEFLSMRCSLLLKRYPKIDKFINSNVEKIIKVEKAILQSFVI